MLAEHVIERVRQIRHRVDQRAVEVEDQQKIGHREEVCAAMVIIRNNLCVGCRAGIMQPFANESRFVRRGDFWASRIMTKARFVASSSSPPARAPASIRRFRRSCNELAGWPMIRHLTEALRAS